MEKNGLYGLVLAGGRSTRMGKDKAQIPYHGQPHGKYLYALLSSLCDRTFLSVRSEQAGDFPPDYDLIVDKNQYKGPFNGILSACDQFPHRSFLVVACDLPLIDQSSLSYLINQRDPEKCATAFATRKTGLPEPLVAIWEARGLQNAKEYLRHSESSCPRKYLLNSDIKLIQPTDDRVLLNANFEEEYLEVMKILSAHE